MGKPGVRFTTGVPLAGSGYRESMADDEALPDFPDERKNDADTEVPTAPAGPEDDSGDVDEPMNSA